MNNKETPEPRKRARKVKVFGERNTGTRAVMQMLRALKGVSISAPAVPTPDLDLLEKRVIETLKGFHREIYIDALYDEARRRNGGLSAWKHAAPVVDDSYGAKDASVLFLVRDPYSWVLSLGKRPYHTRAPKLDSVKAFVERPWLAMGRDNIDTVLISPMVLWNEKLRAYRAFAKAAPVPSTALKFEDFVLEPVAALTRALAEFNIPAKGLTEIAPSTKRGGMGREVRRAHYASEAWKSELDANAVAAINTYVDWDVATSFGYEMRAPEAFSRG